MITTFTKKTVPNPPGRISEVIIPNTAIVPGSASVPVEIKFTGSYTSRQSGIDIVFCIDDSGSTSSTDPDKLRYKAILRMIDNFGNSRNHFDRIAVIIFKGMQSELIQDWASWSDTTSTIERLLEHEPEDSTPMAHAMNKAIDLLINSSGFYKVAILISDGAAYPDVLTDYPVQAIFGLPPYHERNSLVYKAWINRIIFSTIFLEPTGEYDSTVLMDIAKRTDYITDYQAYPDNPRYYFRVRTDFDEILFAYENLFNFLANRFVPQNLKFTEVVNEKLVIDPDADISFYGDGFNIDQNILDFGSEDLLDLDDALRKFQTTRKFSVRLNELKGDALLKFSVKLNTVYFNNIPNEIPDGDKICVPIDVIDSNAFERGSYLTFLSPNEDASGSSTTLVTFPQAIVCFKKGISVTKNLVQVRGKYNEVIRQKVKIDAVNNDLEQVDWVSLAEFPSGFINTSSPLDDFNFNPYQMLLEHKIARLFASKIIKILEIPRWHRSLIRKVHSSVKEAVLGKYSFLTDQIFDINSYLKQFMFIEAPHENNNIDRFWRTENQRGYYILEENFSPLTSRTLEFSVEGASFKSTGDYNETLPWYTDALKTKFEMESMSWYNFAGSSGKKEVEPNPEFLQLTTNTKRADLYVNTCFAGADLSKLFDLYTKNYINSAYWELLKSSDISPKIDLRGKKISADIKVNNCGEISGSGDINGTCIILPLREQDFKYRNDVFEYKPSTPIIAKGKLNSGIIEAHGFKNIKIKYKFDRTHDEENFIEGMTGIVITLVQITNCAGEKLIGNNKAVDISLLEGNIIHPHGPNKHFG